MIDCTVAVRAEPFLVRRRRVVSEKSAQALSRFCLSPSFASPSLPVGVMRRMATGGGRPPSEVSELVME